MPNCGDCGHTQAQHPTISGTDLFGDHTTVSPCGVFGCRCPRFIPEEA